jgi:hypothetical protein
MRQQKRRNELMPYNDCVYRHVRTHDWALIVDTDEVVVPLRHDNWTHMLDDIVGHAHDDTLTSLSIINAFKFDNLTTHFDEQVSPHMHMLRHRCVGRGHTQ